MKFLLNLFILFQLISLAYAQKNVVLKNNSSFELKNLPLESSNFDSLSCGLNFKKGKHYVNEKGSIKTIRINLLKKYNSLKNTLEKKQFLDSANTILTTLLLNKIVPYWYGTVWDFNGYTSVPNQGVIACGYFVSTTLRDVGVNVNRYRLAQQNPENEAKSIAIDTNNIFSIQEKDIQKKLKTFSDGLYFVGLDNHVGYLYIKNSISYFLHSNYRDGKVMIETTSSSLTFGSSQYYISKISGNNQLTKKWLNQQKIKVFL